MRESFFQVTALKAEKGKWIFMKSTDMSSQERNCGYLEGDGFMLPPKLLDCPKCRYHYVDQSLGNCDIKQQNKRVQNDYIKRQRET